MNFEGRTFLNDQRLARAAVLDRSSRVRAGVSDQLLGKTGYASSVREFVGLVVVVKCTNGYIIAVQARTCGTRQPRLRQASWLCPNYGKTKQGTRECCD